MKILYYYSKLKIGGAERSTIRLMNELADHGHKVTLLLRWNGDLESELNSDIKRIYLKKAVPVFERLGKLGTLMNHAVGMVSLFYKKYFVLKKDKYDIAINGLLGYDPSILFEHIQANCYMQMLRNDVSLTRNYGKTEHYMKKYGKHFDAYIGVSEYVTNSFKTSYPELAERAYTIYNILPNIDTSIFRECPQIYCSDKTILRILTVCRLEEKSKGLLRMTRIAQCLHKEFPGKFKWYIVGSGQDRQLFQDEIEELGLEDILILCGATGNPLPYYAHADLVAVLSYYEGLCGVVNEAKLMCRPVIATRFSGIDEQIKNGINGIIVENDEKSILEKMRQILMEPDSIKRYEFNGMPEKLLDNKGKVKDLVNLYKKITCSC